MKKLILGALLGGALVYFLDSERGAERRGHLNRRWSEQKDTVLDLARTAGGAAGTVSAGVTELVDQAHKTGPNGLEVESGASTTIA